MHFKKHILNATTYLRPTPAAVCSRAVETHLKKLGF